MNKEEIESLVDKHSLYYDSIGRQIIDENGIEDLKEELVKLFAISSVVQQSEQYCECEIPTLGKSISRCGTCDEWFKPLK